MVNQNLIIKSADLVIAPAKSEHDVRTMLHTLPQGKGWVFGLMDLEHKDDIGRERVAHILSSHLEHLAADLAQDVNAVRRFEQGLSRINRDLSRAAKDLSLKIEKFQGVVGVVSKNQIFLSGLGELRALFLHKTAERRYVIYELDAQFHDGEERTWEKPFLAVLDGELHPGDIFYLASRVSHNIINMNELQDVLVTLPPAGALQRIQQYLPPTEPYAAVAFHAMEEDKTGVIRKANPIGSLKELAGTKERTATVLGDQQPDLVSTVKELGNSLSKKLASPGTRGALTTLKRGLKILVSVGAKVAAVVATGLSKLGQMIGDALSKHRTSRALKRGTGHSRTTRATSAMSGAGKFIRDLSAPRKLGLLSFLLIMVILGGVLFLNNGASDKQKAQEAFASSVTGIEEKILAAEASLIYKNNAEAQRHFDEAAVALEALPKETPEQMSEADRLAEQLTTLQAKIRGLTLVQPTLLANFRTLESSASLVNATGTVNGIVALGDNLSVYTLAKGANAWSNLQATHGPLSRIVSSTTSGEDALVIDSTQQLGRADISALTLNPIASGTNNMASVEDITVYNDSLYALTAKSQQIVKMRAQGETYEAGTPWITARTTDLSTARAVAIDANVYVLLANDIVKFTSGREQTWPHGPIDPPLSQPTDLWTAFESKYLYILEPAEKRILVLDKEAGSVRAQYVAEEFGQAVSFIVEEAAQHISVVTPTAAYEFTPTHLSAPQQ